MSPEKQRIAIAEACGLKTPFFENREWFEDYEAEGWRRVMRSDDGQRVPDYLNDLNAMAEAEKVLESHPKRDDFGDYLAQVVLGYGPEKSGTITLNLWALRRLIRATAAQRAEAFLRTIGKWEEAP